MEEKASPSTPTASLSIRHLTRRLKSLQHERCSPKTGQHMEYAGNVTHREQYERVMLYYMHIWLVESSMVTVLHKANFFLQQRNKFYLTIMVVVKH